jgi:hypothetical protein
MEGESFVVSVFRRIGLRFAGSIAALCLALCNSGTATGLVVRRSWAGATGERYPY